MPTPTFALLPLMAVRNPAWLELPTPGRQQAAPVASVTALVFLANPTAGQRITFTLPDGSTTSLEAVSGTPDGSATQYQISGTSGGTIANLVATANLNPQLLQWYTITNNSGQAVFTARSAADHAPDVEWDSPVWGFAIPSTPGSNGTYAPGYHMGLTLWVEEVWGSGTYTRLPDVVAEPGADGRVRYDVSTLLKPYVGYDWPAYGASVPLRCTRLQRRLYAEHWEAWGDPLRPRAVTRTGTLKAWYAGTRQQEEHPDWSQLAATLVGTNVNADYLTPWLTYRGRGLGTRHEVDPGQQHYLGWYHRVATQELELRATVWYTDGTSASTTALSDEDVPQGEIALWPCGFDVLELGDLQPSKTPYKYAVQLRTAGDTPTAVSELHTFWLAAPDANTLHIEWVNSLGAVESLRTTGQWTLPVEAAHEAITTARTVQNGAYPATHQSAQRSLLVGVQAVLQVETGLVDARERDALLDLLYSPEWRLVDHASGRKLPLQLAGSQQLGGQQGTPTEHLHRLRLEFVAGDAEMAWSAMGTLPPAPDLEPTPPDA